MRKRKFDKNFDRKKESEVSFYKWGEYSSIFGGKYFDFGRNGYRAKDQAELTGPSQTTCPQANDHKQSSVGTKIVLGRFGDKLIDIIF